MPIRNGVILKLEEIDTKAQSSYATFTKWLLEQKIESGALGSEIPKDSSLAVACTQLLNAARGTYKTLSDSGLSDEEKKNLEKSLDSHIALHAEKIEKLQGEIEKLRDEVTGTILKYKLETRIQNLTKKIEEVNTEVKDTLPKINEIRLFLLKNKLETLNKLIKKEGLTDQVKKDYKNLGFPSEDKYNQNGEYLNTIRQSEVMADKSPTVNVLKNELIKLEQQIIGAYAEIVGKVATEQETQRKEAADQQTAVKRQAIASAEKIDRNSLTQKELQRQDRKKVEEDQKKTDEIIQYMKDVEQKVTGIKELKPSTPEEIKQCRALITAALPFVSQTGKERKSRASSFDEGQKLKLNSFWQEILEIQKKLNNSAHMKKTSQFAGLEKRTPLNQKELNSSDPSTVPNSSGRKFNSPLGSPTVANSSESVKATAATNDSISVQDKNDRPPPLVTDIAENTDAKQVAEQQQLNEGSQNARPYTLSSFDGPDTRSSSPQHPDTRPGSPVTNSQDPNTVGNALAKEQQKQNTISDNPHTANGSTLSEPYRSDTNNRQLNDGGAHYVERSDTKLRDAEEKRDEEQRKLAERESRRGLEREADEKRSKLAYEQSEAMIELQRAAEQQLHDLVQKESEKNAEAVRARMRSSIDTNTVATKEQENYSIRSSGIHLPQSTALQDTLSPQQEWKDLVQPLLDEFRNQNDNLLNNNDDDVLSNVGALHEKKRFFINNLVVNGLENFKINGRGFDDFRDAVEDGIIEVIKAYQNSPALNPDADQGVQITLDESTPYPTASPDPLDLEDGSPKISDGTEDSFEGNTTDARQTQAAAQGGRPERALIVSADHAVKLIRQHVDKMTELAIKGKGLIELLNSLKDKLRKLDQTTSADTHNDTTNELEAYKNQIEELSEECLRVDREYSRLLSSTEHYVNSFLNNERFKSDSLESQVGDVKSIKANILPANKTTKEIFSTTHVPLKKFLSDEVARLSLRSIVIPAGSDQVQDGLHTEPSSLDVRLEGHKASPDPHVTSRSIGSTNKDNQQGGSSESPTYELLDASYFPESKKHFSASGSLDTNRGFNGDSDAGENQAAAGQPLINNNAATRVGRSVAKDKILSKDSNKGINEAQKVITAAHTELGKLKNNKDKEGPVAIAKAAYKIALTSANEAKKLYLAGNNTGADEALQKATALNKTARETFPHLNKESATKESEKNTSKATKKHKATKNARSTQESRSLSAASLNRVPESKALAASRVVGAKNQAKDIAEATDRVAAEIDARARNVAEGPVGVVLEPNVYVHSDVNIQLDQRRSPVDPNATAGETQQQSLNGNDSLGIAAKVRNVMEPVSPPDGPAANAGSVGLHENREKLSSSTLLPDQPEVASTQLNKETNVEKNGAKEVESEQRVLNSKSPDAAEQSDQVVDSETGSPSTNLDRNNVKSQIARPDPHDALIKFARAVRAEQRTPSEADATVGKGALDDLLEGVGEMFGVNSLESQPKKTTDADTTVAVTRDQVEKVAVAMDNAQPRGVANGGDEGVQAQNDQSNRDISKYADEQLRKDNPQTAFSLNGGSNLGVSQDTSSIDEASASFDLTRDAGNEAITISRQPPSPIASNNQENDMDEGKSRKFAAPEEAKIEAEKKRKKKISHDKKHVKRQPTHEDIDAAAKEAVERKAAEPVMQNTPVIKMQEGSSVASDFYSAMEAKADLMNRIINAGSKFKTSITSQPRNEKEISNQGQSLSELVGLYNDVAERYSNVVSRASTLLKGVAGDNVLQSRVKEALRKKDTEQNADEEVLRALQELIRKNRTPVVAMGKDTSALAETQEGQVSPLEHMSTGGSNSDTSQNARPDPLGFAERSVLESALRDIATDRNVSRNSGAAEPEEPVAPSPIGGGATAGSKSLDEELQGPEGQQPNGNAAQRRVEADKTERGKLHIVLEDGAVPSLLDDVNNQVSLDRVSPLEHMSTGGSNSDTSQNARPDPLGFAVGSVTKGLPNLNGAAAQAGFETRTVDLASSNDGLNQDNADNSPHQPSVTDESKELQEFNDAKRNEFQAYTAIGNKAKDLAGLIQSGDPIIGGDCKKQLETLGKTLASALSDTQMKFDNLPPEIKTQASSKVIQRTKDAKALIEKAVSDGLNVIGDAIAKRDRDLAERKPLMSSSPQASEATATASHDEDLSDFAGSVRIEGKTAQRRPSEAGPLGSDNDSVLTSAAEMFSRAEEDSPRPVNNSRDINQYDAGVSQKVGPDLHDVRNAQEVQILPFAPMLTGGSNLDTRKNARPGYHGKDKKSSGDQKKGINEAQKVITAAHTELGKLKNNKDKEGPVAIAKAAYKIALTSANEAKKLYLAGNNTGADEALQKATEANKKAQEAFPHVEKNLAPKKSEKKLIEAAQPKIPAPPNAPSVLNSKKTDTVGTDQQQNTLPSKNNPITQNNGHMSKAQQAALDQQKKRNFVQDNVENQDSYQSRRSPLVNNTTAIERSVSPVSVTQQGQGNDLDTLHTPSVIQPAVLTEGADANDRGSPIPPIPEGGVTTSQDAGGGASQNEAAYIEAVLTDMHRLKLNALRQINQNVSAFNHYNFQSALYDLRKTIPAKNDTANELMDNIYAQVEFEYDAATKVAAAAAFKAEGYGFEVDTSMAEEAYLKAFAARKIEQKNLADGEAQARKTLTDEGAQELTTLVLDMKNALDAAVTQTQADAKVHSNEDAVAATTTVQQGAERENKKKDDNNNEQTGVSAAAPATASTQGSDGGKTAGAAAQAADAATEEKELEHGEVPTIDESLEQKKATDAATNTTTTSTTGNNPAPVGTMNNAVTQRTTTAAPNPKNSVLSSAQSQPVNNTNTAPTSLQIMKPAAPTHTNAQPKPKPNVSNNDPQQQKGRSKTSISGVSSPTKSVQNGFTHVIYGARVVGKDPGLSYSREAISLDVQDHVKLTNGGGVKLKAPGGREYDFSMSGNTPEAVLQPEQHQATSPEDKAALARTIINMMDNVAAKSGVVNVNTEDPFVKAIAEKYQKENPGIDINIKGPDQPVTPEHESAINTVMAEMAAIKNTPADNNWRNQVTKIATQVQVKTQQAQPSQGFNVQIPRA